MPGSRCAFAAFLLLCYAALTPQASARPFGLRRRTPLVLALFGDSLTDTGNSLAASGSPDPALYYKGRFSNGPNWVDYLGNAVQEANGTALDVRNYAFGGATACEPSGLVAALTSGVHNLGTQTASFLDDTEQERLPAGVPLVPVQFIGANDVLYAFLEAMVLGDVPDAAFIAQLIANTTRCRMDALDALAQLAQVKDIIVLQMPPLYAAPVVPAAFSGMARDIVTQLDGAMAAAVQEAQVRYDKAGEGSPLYGTKLHVLLDTSWMEEAMSEVQPPFRDTKDACLDTLSGFTSIPIGDIGGGAQERSNATTTTTTTATTATSDGSGSRAEVEEDAQPAAPGSTNTTRSSSSSSQRQPQQPAHCLDPDTYLFYDPVHPTTRYHRFVATQGILPRLRGIGLLSNA